MIDSIIYRKQGQYDDEIRVLEKAIWVFENLAYQLRADDSKKLMRFKERLVKVLANFYRNLIISHLVHCYNTDDASTKMEGTMIMLRVDQVSSAQRAYRSPTWVNQKDDL